MQSSHQPVSNTFLDIINRDKELLRMKQTPRNFNGSMSSTNIEAFKPKTISPPNLEQNTSPPSSRAIPGAHPPFPAQTHSSNTLHITSPQPPPQKYIQKALSSSSSSTLSSYFRSNSLLPNEISSQNVFLPSSPPPPLPSSSIMMTDALRDGKVVSSEPPADRLTALNQPSPCSAMPSLKSTAPRVSSSSTSLASPILSSSSLHFLRVHLANQQPTLKETLSTKMRHEQSVENEQNQPNVTNSLIDRSSIKGYPSDFEKLRIQHFKDEMRQLRLEHDKLKVENGKLTAENKWLKSRLNVHSERCTCNKSFSSCNDEYSNNDDNINTFNSRFSNKRFFTNNNNGTSIVNSSSSNNNNISNDNAVHSNISQWKETVWI
ncbi:hypothetical protein HELRODRAFT_169546 [Helobdella robusta]|uniref:Uncharacterized protein n=1 Tax=Helobdella robusta TaxID=6412 RepID=T1F228_HELRO|nr:hypothetical protein HELRODRAFT_169546 [Helobdella robusta]ESO08658.1 hypothetical protein HELRODRAFT_169546 [Helobdella robusta]